MDIKVFKKNDEYCVVFNDKGERSDLYHVGSQQEIEVLYDAIKSVLADGNDGQALTGGSSFAIVKANDAQYIISMAVTIELAIGYKFSPQEIRHFASMLEKFLY